MKLTTKNLNPKHLFKSKQKKSNSVSRSESESFSSSISASSGSGSGSPDPTSVLPNHAFSSSIITRSELENVLIRIGASGSSELEEIRLMMNEMDRDGDGSISLNEFESVVFGVTPLSDGEIKSAFEFFDTDGDGMITESELFEVFKLFGECSLEDCKRMITSVDKNGDGFVCFADFALMMDQQFHQR